MQIKRVLLGLGAVVVVLVATPFVAFAVTMAGDSPVKDGEALGARAKQVKDGFVTVGVVDVGGGMVALVDCGDDKDAKAVSAELEKRNLDLERREGGLPHARAPRPHRWVCEVSEGRRLRDGRGERPRRRAHRREGA